MAHTPGKKASKQPDIQDSPAGGGATRAARQRRSVGRPQSDKDAVGREALISATIELLKFKSHDKINRLEIARFAGVDPGLIRYYFGDVRTLFGEVIIRISQNFRESISNAARGARPELQLRWRVKRNVELFMEYPHHYALVADIVYSNHNSPARDAWREIIRSSLTQLEEILNEGDNDGTMRRIEHRFLHLLLIGSSQFYANSDNLLSDMFSDARSADDMKDDYIEFVTDLILNGISKR